MVDVPDAVVEELAGLVSAAVPRVVARIPAAPAAELGRLRASAGAGSGPPMSGAAAFRHAAVFRDAAVGSRPVVRSGDGARGVDSPVREALDSVPVLLVERLLGALELTVPELDVAGGPDFSGLLGEPFTGSFSTAGAGGRSAAISGAAVLDQVRPGALPLVADVTRVLAAHPRISVLLTVGPGVTDEDGIAAAHGAAYLALAVASAAAILHHAGIHPWALDPPAVVGVAVGVAVLLLRDAPMPARYADAVLARIRDDYVLPRYSQLSAAVTDHRFALTENGDTPEAGFTANGLVAVVPGGVVIRTGVQSGHVPVQVTVTDGPPPRVADGWEEIVEVSWRADVGGATLTGPGGTGRPGAGTPPWPGDYRVRVHARGRDDADGHGSESYELVVWQAPAAPELVHVRSDRLGHRLRGEPEPVRPELPEIAYRWLRRSSLDVAATVTVVTGAGVEEVLRAFGADPDRPEAMRAIDADLMRRQSIDPWVAVLDVGDAVLAVEYNGWQGSTAPVLTRASSGGRAASMYWNINASTRLSFAEHGRILLSVEPLRGTEAPPALAGTLDGLDFADHRRGTPAMGLVAVERFAGRGITADDVARIEAADIAFRIVPHLPPLYRRPPRPDGPLGPAVAALTRLTESEQRDLAWWAAAEAARYAGVAGDPDVAAALTARALTGDAAWRARQSRLDTGEHRWLWSALHQATNPDPTTAAAKAIDAARYAAGPHAADLLADAEARISQRLPR